MRETQQWNDMIKPVLFKIGTSADKVLFSTDRQASLSGHIWSLVLSRGMAGHNAIMSTVSRGRGPDKLKYKRKQT
jgi:hypothetical protein